MLAADWLRQPMMGTAQETRSVAVTQLVILKKCEILLGISNISVIQFLSL